MSSPWKLRGYVVEELLGCGASGDVWRARVAGSGDLVALKRLLVRDAEQAHRAHAEAALLSVLDHPSLVRLHAVVPADDVAVLVLDLADGGSLADVLAARGRLTPGEVITALAPIAGALSYVHGQGVVHGDVSPANVLFTAGGSPLLADLGVARLTGDDSDAESTPAYVDPAVAAGRVPAAASDVFMLGAVTLHALTGAALWPGATAELALAAARAGDLHDVQQRLARACVPKAMATVVGRALVADPARRCTAADFALDLGHSGTPIAVELSAGRVRLRPAPAEPTVAGAVEPAVHGQTTPRLGSPAQTGPSERPPVQPTVPRVGRHAAVVGPPPPTRAVRRPRPELPTPRRRRDVRRLIVVAAAFVVLALALAGGVAWAATSDSPPERHAVRHAPKPKPIPTSTRTPSASHPTPSPSATSGAPGADDWPDALRRLDALRAQAFATRDAALLARVYVPGPLLTADTSMLMRTVPTGCRLMGVRTTYDDLTVDATASEATVTTSATLAPSTLTCPGAAERHAPGAGPTRLEVRLVGTAGGLRIAAERQV